MVRAVTRELVEFLHDDLRVESFPWAEFPHRVGLRNSCSSVRCLGLARPTPPRTKGRLRTDKLCAIDLTIR